MTVSQWIGVWIVAAGLMVAAVTVAVVTLGLYMIAIKQEEDRRYGLRRGGSRPEAGGHGWQALAGEGPPSSDRETLARVGWVGIEKVRD